MTAKIVKQINVDSTAMASGKQQLQYMSDGTLNAITDFTSLPVTIKEGDEDVEIGTLGGYITTQYITAEGAKKLLLHLKEQYKTQKGLLKPHQDFMEQHKHIDPEMKVVELLNEMKTDDKFKRFPKLEKYAEMVTSKDNAIKTVEKFGNILDVLKQQIDFLEENFA